MNSGHGFQGQGVSRLGDLHALFYLPILPDPG